MADKNIWSAHAAEIGKLHAIPVDNIDQGNGVKCPSKIEYFP